MSRQWVVLLHTGVNDVVVYGPLYDEARAEQFAAFLTAEVDPARVRPLKSPIGELLGFWSAMRAGEGKPDGERPVRWPPSPGDVWEDRNRDRWVCTRTPGNIPYLVCIAKQADDGAEEIWRLHGPLTFVESVTPNAEEPPF